jgi:hypothetical protein
MIRKIDRKSGAWWSRQAVAEGQSPQGEVPESVAPILAGEAREGWDPWEVWLRRIDQPRRRLTDGGSTRD